MHLKKTILLLLSFTTLWGLDIPKPKVHLTETPIVKAIKTKKYNNFKKIFNTHKLHKRYNLNQTLLHIAVRYNNQKVTKFLVKKGAELNAVGGEYNATPLHTAIRYGYISLTVYLIKMKASLNIKDKYGETPLDIATRLNYSNIIELLKKRGAVTSESSKKSEESNNKVNKYRDGGKVNKYKNFNAVNKYRPKIQAKKIELRHNKLESELEGKNNKIIGLSNSKIEIGN